MDVGTTNLVGSSNYESSTGSAPGTDSLAGLTGGNLYYWTPGVNDTSLVVTNTVTNTTTTLTSAGVFQAPTSGTVTLNGVAGAAVTATVYSAAGTTGLLLTDVGFTLLRFTDKTVTPNVTYTALEASEASITQTIGSSTVTQYVGSGSFVGVSGLTLSLNAFSAQLNETSNTSNPNLVLDFGQGDQAGGTPVASPLSGAPTIGISGTGGGTLLVSGSVAFDAFGNALGTASFTMSQQYVNVTVSTSTTLTNADLLTFSMTDVNLFAGVNGSLTYGSNNNVTIDTANATGFAVTNGYLGLAMVLGGSGQPVYLALDGEIGSASLVGLPAGMVVSGTNIGVEVNQASGSASALDWATALTNPPTFFPGTSQAINLNSFTTGLIQVTGTLNLQFSEGGAVVFEANATFTMAMQSVNVQASSSVNLPQAQMFSLQIQLFNPGGLTAGQEYGLIVGEPGGFGFTVNSGQLTYAQVTPNSNPSVNTQGWQGSYYALTASVTGATLTGLPSGVSIEATNLGFTLNSSSGTLATSGTPALTWSTVTGSPAGLSTLTGSEFSISGNLMLDIEGFVLGSGSFVFSQAGGQTISDGTSLTTSALTDVTIQQIGVTDLNLFIGVNGGFGALDSNGNATISSSQGTGFSVTGASLELVTATEATGQQRSWMAVLAQVEQMTAQDLPVTMQVQSLNLLYNVPDQTTSTTLNWAGVQVGSTALSAYLNLNPAMTQLMSQLTVSTSLSVSGTAFLDIAGYVVATGNFSVTEQSGLTVNDGTLNLTKASLLVIGLTDVNLFVGTGGVTSFTTGALYQANAVGFSATGVSLTVAVLSQTGTNARTWVGLGGSIGSMSAVGGPGDFTLNVLNLSVLDNIAASDNSRINWQELAGQSGNPYGLANTPLTGLPNSTSFTITGMMTVSIENYVYIGGAFALEETTLSATTGSSSSSNKTYTSMSALIFGGQNLVAFVGAGGPYWEVVDTLTVTTGSNFNLTNGASTEAVAYSSNAATMDGNIQTALMSLDSQITYTVVLGSTNTTANTTTYYIQPAGTMPTLSVTNVSSGGSGTFAANQFVAVPNSTAMGVTMTLNNLALVLMTPTAAGSTQSYFALDASGSAALIGVSGVTLSGQATVAVNQGYDTSLSNPQSAPAVNFAASAAEDQSQFGSPTGLVVPTGPGTSTTLNFNTATLSVTGMMSFAISQFVYATGNFSIQQANSTLTTAGTVTLAGGGTVTGVSVFTIGASDVNVFVGTGGPYFNGTSTPSAAGATGVAFSNISFALALMSSQTSAASFYALQASGSGALVGVSGVNVSAQNVTIQVNGGTSSGSSAAVNFTQSFTGGSLSVATGGSPIVLQYSTALVNVTGSVTLSIGNNVYISGTMSFSDGGTVTATLSDGTTKQVSVLTVGASSVSIFVGLTGLRTVLAPKDSR